MLSLHRETHCFLIEPLSETRHIMLSLYKRYIKLTKNLSQSKKGPLRNLYNLIKYDCISTTGSNLRRLMLRLDVRQLEELNADIIGQAIYIKISRQKMSGKFKEQKNSLKRSTTRVSFRILAPKK